MELLNYLFGPWALFGSSILTASFLGVALALLGVVAVARDQVFVGLAAAQFSAFGVALALWLSATVAASQFASPEAQAVVAGLFSVMAMLFAQLRPARRAPPAPGAVSGWLFILSSSGTLVLLSQSPLGLEEVQRLFASSMLGATARDVSLSLGLLLAVLLYVVSQYPKITLMLIDPAAAKVQGVATRYHSVALAFLMGLGIGQSVLVAGLLFTVAALILPPLMATLICRRSRSVFPISVMLYLSLSLPSLSLAYRTDCPPGQMIALVLSLATAAVWGCKRNLRS